MAPPTIQVALLQTLAGTFASAGCGGGAGPAFWHKALSPHPAVGWKLASHSAPASPPPQRCQSPRQR